MLTKSIAVIGLAVGVIVAAGAGAYLAVRQNASAPPLLAEVATRGATIEPASAEPPELVRPAVEATEAVADTLDKPVFNDIQTPAAREREPQRQEPVAAPTPPSPPSRSAPAERASEATPVSTPAVIDETTATVANAPPATPVPVQTARADLPKVEGWTRPQATEPSLETAAIIPDIGSIDRPVPRPVSEFVEFEIAADSVIGLQIDTAVSTRTAKVEDTVEARVTRDVLIADQVAVPAGTRMLGSVVLVETGGRLRNASRLGVRFHTLMMDGGLQVPIVTETIYREGASRGSDSVAKIGGAAVGGAILGAIFGGGRGAAIGGSIGAAGGTAAALNGEAKPAGLPPGTRLTVRLSRPVAVTVEQ
jgi:hypothetical protein